MKDIILLIKEFNNLIDIKNKKIFEEHKIQEREEGEIYIADTLPVELQSPIYYEKDFTTFVEFISTK